MVIALQEEITAAHALHQILVLLEVVLLGQFQQVALLLVEHATPLIHQSAG